MAVAVSAASHGLRSEVSLNRLTGLPTEIGRLPALLFLWLGNNRWNTTIPSQLGLLSLILIL